ncbi:hypothetical protein ACB098_12G030600 [Castanea mollissima]
MHEKRDKLINTCTWCYVGYEAFTYFVKYKYGDANREDPTWGDHLSTNMIFDMTSHGSKVIILYKGMNKHIQAECLNEPRGESHSTYRHIVIRTCSSGKGIWKTPPLV